MWPASLPGAASLRAIRATPQGRWEHRGRDGCSRGMIEERFARLLGGRKQGVLVTRRADGSPQLSNVNYQWYPDEQLIRISVTDDRVKTRNLRRDPRAAFHVTSDDFWSYTVIEGTATLSDVAAKPDDEAVEELV